MTLSVAAVAIGLAVIAALGLEFSLAVSTHVKRWVRNRRNFWRWVPHTRVDHTGGQFFKPARFYLPASMRDHK